MFDHSIEVIRDLKGFKNKTHEISYNISQPANFAI